MESNDGADFCNENLSAADLLTHAIVIWTNFKEKNG